MDDWLKRVAAAIGSDEEISGKDADALLDIARIAAHESGDRPIDEILEAVRGSSS